MSSDAQLIGWTMAGGWWGIRTFDWAPSARNQMATWLVVLVRRRREDLLAEVWIAAFHGRGTFDTRFESARPWLFTIARNVLNSHLRQRSQLHFGSTSPSCS